MPDFNLNKAVEWPYPVNYGKENEADGRYSYPWWRRRGSSRRYSSRERAWSVKVVDKGAVAMGDYDYNGTKVFLIPDYQAWT